MFGSLLPGAIGIQLPLAQTVELAQRLDYGGVAVSLKEAMQLGLDRTRELFARAGLQLGSWGLPVQFRQDEETFNKGLADLESRAAFAGLLGATRCSTWIMPCSNELDYDANFNLHAQRLRHVARVLNNCGCRLGLEFVGPTTLRRSQKHEFVYDMPGMFRLIRAIGADNVGLLLDSFHWYTSGGTADDLATLRPEQIVDVHLNDAVPGRSADEQLDNERMLPGESGLIDLRTFLSALHRMGYDGPAGVEPFSARLKTMSPDESAAATVAAMKNVWRQAAVPWKGATS